MSKKYKIYKIPKSAPKKLSSRIDITEFITSDITISTTLNSESDAFQAEFLITSDDVRNKPDKVIDTYYLPNIVEESDILHITLEDSATGKELSLGFFLCQITIVDDINNNNQVISDSVYTGKLSGVALDVYTRGFRMPNKSFTNPSFLLTSGNSRVPDSTVKAEFNLQKILEILFKVADINSPLAPGALDISNFDLTPLEESLGNRSLSDIVPNRSIVLEGLSLQGCISEILREEKVIPSVRYVIDGIDNLKSYDPLVDRDLKIQLYDKQQNFKDISRPFLVESNIQGDITRTETVDSSAYPTSIVTDLTNSITGDNPMFVKGIDNEVYSDYYNYPALDMWTSLTTFDKQTFFTADDRNSAVLKLPYAINKLDSGRILQFPGAATTNKSRVRSNLTRDWIKNIDITKVENSKFKYDIGTDTISGFFDSTTLKSGGIPRSVAAVMFSGESQSSWADGQIGVDNMKFNIQYEPIINNFSSSRSINTEGIPSIPKIDAESKTSINFSRNDRIQNIKDKNIGQSFTSIGQVLYYDEFSLDDYFNISIQSGDRTEENRVAVSVTTRLAAGDNVLEGYVDIKADLVKNYVQSNLDQKAITNFDPLSGGGSSIQRNDIISDYLVVYTDNEEVEFGIDAADVGNFNSFARSRILEHIADDGGTFDQDVNQSTNREANRASNNTAYITGGMVNHKYGSSSFTGSTETAFFVSPKTYNGVSTCGVIISALDNVNFAPPSPFVRGSTTGTGGGPSDGDNQPRNVITMIQNRYGNQFNQVKEMSVRLIQRYTVQIKQLLEGSTPRIRESGGNEREIRGDASGGGFFSAYPRLSDGNTYNSFKYIVSQWNGTSDTRKVTKIQVVENSYNEYCDFSYDCYKDTQENLQIQVEVNAKVSPSKYIYGPGLLAPADPFTALVGQGDPNYLIVEFNDNLPLEILNIREIFEDYKFNIPTGVITVNGTSDKMYKITSTSVVDEEVYPQGASRYSSGMRIKSTGKIKLVQETAPDSNKYVSNDLLSYGVDYRYWMIFNSRGELVLRSLKEYDQDKFNVSLLNHDPFLVKL